MIRFLPKTLFRALRIAVCLPFLALCLLPQGVMPVRAADGTMVLTLCTGAGAVDMVIDLSTGREVPARAPDRAPDRAKSDKPCDWTSFQSQVLMPDGDGLTVVALVVRMDFVPLPAQVFLPAHDPRGLFARGPPQPV
jgi:hypothetical protein